MTDLAQYLEEIVEPTVKDFEQNPTSRRDAFLACVAVCHGVDYLAYPDDPRTLRQSFERESQDFKIVNDVGHTFKHVFIGKREEPRLTHTEVISRPPAYFGVVVWNLSRWDDSLGGVTLNSKRSVDLLETVRNAVTFLWSKIGKAGTAAVRQTSSAPSV
jgi:hypothetical protein